eukprot:m.82207 g.82207  ORF g.82207 m.82207 type:complete len:226 (-) comp14903_c0_seq1:930-1607(-)
MPCSRVYHVFRSGGTPYQSPSTHLARNKLRTAAIWMDDYGFLVEKALATEVSAEVVGPLKHMRELRERLQCKPFDWFLKNVYPESIITDMTDIKSLGLLENKASGECIQMNTEAGSPAQMEACGSRPDSYAFVALANKELRVLVDMEKCLRDDLTIAFCEGQGERVQWLVERGAVRSKRLNRCLSINEQTKVLTLEDCKASITRQHWLMPKFDRAKAKPVAWDLP